MGESEGRRCRQWLEKVSRGIRVRKGEGADGEVKK